MVFEVAEARLRSDETLRRCWRRFLEGDDAYKNRRIKLITSVVDANWAAKQMIGPPVPALIGRHACARERGAAGGKREGGREGGREGELSVFSMTLHLAHGFVGLRAADACSSSSSWQQQFVGLRAADACSSSNSWQQQFVGPRAADACSSSSRPASRGPLDSHVYSLTSTRLSCLFPH